MEPHSEELRELALSHFNEPMLNEYYGILRCVGYAETAIDCYIIGRRIGGELVWQTCVGGYYWLDRFIGQGNVRSASGEDWDDFTRLDNLLTLNGAPKETSPIIRLHHDDWEGGLPRTAA